MCERITGIDILDFPLGEEFDFLPDIQERKSNQSKNPRPTQPIIRPPKPECEKKHIKKDGKR